MKLRLQTSTITSISSRQSSSSIFSSLSPFSPSSPQIPGSPSFSSSLRSSSSSSLSPASPASLHAALSLSSLLLGLLLGLLLLPSLLPTPPSSYPHPSSPRETSSSRLISHGSSSSLLNREEASLPSPTEASTGQLLPPGLGNATSRDQSTGDATSRRQSVLAPPLSSLLSSHHQLQQRMQKNADQLTRLQRTRAEQVQFIHWWQSLVFVQPDDSFLEAAERSLADDSMKSVPYSLLGSDWSIGKGWAAEGLLPEIEAVMRGEVVWADGREEREEEGTMRKLRAGGREISESTSAGQRRLLIDGHGEFRAGGGEELQTAGDVASGIGAAVGRCVDLRGDIEQASKQQQAEHQLAAQKAAATIQGFHHYMQNSSVQLSPAASQAALDSKWQQFRDACSGKLSAANWALGNWLEGVSLQLGRERGAIAADEEAGNEGAAESGRVRGGHANEKMRVSHARQSSILEPLWLWRTEFEIMPWSSRNVSYVMQYWKVPRTIGEVIDRLFHYSYGEVTQGHYPVVPFSSELLVNADEPSDWQSWLQKWRQLKPEGDFLWVMFSHNLHEIRGYNWPTKAARSPSVVFLQDDDMPPPEGFWVARISQLFAANNNLNPIGYKGMRLTGGWFTTAAAAAGRRGWIDDTILSDKATGHPVLYATDLEFAPVAVRKAAFFSLGGLHEGQAKRGESGIFSDWFYSYRAWLSGSEAMFLNPDPDLIVKPYAAGGTHLPGPGMSLRHQNNIVGGGVYAREVFDPFHVWLRPIIFHQNNRLSQEMNQM